MYLSLPFLAAAVGFVPPSHAAQLELSRPELCAIAELVVLAEVTSGETRWADDESGGIERVRWLHVHEVVSGKAPSTVEVILPGGTMGDLTHWVEDVPELLSNATYLLFLSHVDGDLQVIGGDQGAVRIGTRDEQAGEPKQKALSTVEVCRGA